MKQMTSKLFNRDSLTALCIFGLTMIVFPLSRVHQVTDSRYSMLVSQSLLKHASFTLDEYKIPRYPPTWAGYYFRNGPIYQIEVADGHLYHHMPPGSPILSAPYLALLNVFGISPANADGTYNENWEVRIETSLAAFLMALLATVFFWTARLMLPLSWSVVVALGGALGTQVYSTASRALWSDTWGVFLLGIAILLLLAHETRERQLNPIVLGSILAWTYFVRPTFAVHILAISVYLLIFYRRLFVSYAVTGAVWLIVFVLYSWVHFHQLLPTYYRASRLQFINFGTALAGNLVSPARGLLIYVPVILFVIYLLVRYRRHLIYSRLVWLSSGVIAAHLIVVSGFSHWWGGHSFGPRMTTGLVPWFVLLGILGLAAMLRWRNEQAPTEISRAAWRFQLMFGGVLLLVSLFINTVGATSHATWLWNQRPYEIDQHPERLWDWRQPQFLAGYLPYPPPREFPVIGNARIDFSTPEAEKYLWYGWSEDQAGALWSDNKAAIVFAAREIRSYELNINMTPFLVPGRLDSQRVKFALNGQPLSTFTLTETEPRVYSITLPSEALRERNILSLEAPDAQSPQKLGVSEDPRPRGINLKWIELNERQQARLDTSF